MVSHEVRNSLPCCWMSRSSTATASVGVAAQLVQAGDEVHATRKRRRHAAVAHEGPLEQPARGLRLIEILQHARAEQSATRK